MAAAERRQASQRMVAHLAKRGYPHGRRESTPNHNNIPVDQVGSAAYRRLMAKKREGRL